MVMEGYETKQVIYTNPIRRPTPNAVFRAKYRVNSTIVANPHWDTHYIKGHFGKAEVKEWEQVSDTVLMILFKTLQDAGRDPAKEPDLQKAVREIVGDH